MSYDIIYDKQFIKVKDKFLPFVLVGSNNLYETTYSGKERRVRGWHLWTSNLMKPYTKEELINTCREQLAVRLEKHVGEKEMFGKVEVTTETDVKERYGYYTSLAINGSTHNTSYKSYENIFSIGCDKAIDIETLTKFNGSISIHTSSYSKDELEEKDLESFHINIISEEHFIEVYNEKSVIYGNLLRISLNLNEDKPKRIRKYIKGDVKEKEETVLVRLDGYYTCIAPNGGYFHKNTKYGYKYSFNSPKKFATEKLAKKFAYGKKNCVISKESGEAVLRVEKSLLIKLPNILAVS